MGHLDDIHGRHGEPGAIDHTPDVARESNVVQVVLSNIQAVT